MDWDLMKTMMAVMLKTTATAPMIGKIFLNRPWITRLTLPKLDALLAEEFINIKVILLDSLPIIYRS
jgi:hypothetical protein